MKAIITTPVLMVINLTQDKATLREFSLLLCKEA